MKVQSYIITKKTGAHSREEFKDGTPVVYAMQDPNAKMQGATEFVIYSYRGRNIIKLTEEEARGPLGRKLGLQLFIEGKKAETFDDAVKVPDNWEKLPLGNLHALAAQISGIPVEKLSKSKSIDIISKYVDAREKGEAA